jgi:hypothetical protein
VRIGRLALLVAGLALAGAAAFGLWHVVVGGLINGNPRAGAFGAVLAAVSLAALAILSAVTGRGPVRRLAGRLHEAPPRTGRDA